LTEKAADEILSLPMFAELLDEEIVQVVDAIKEFSNG
jgi:dTDP-4-amino-4,6-dideoxygalactose transaminase